MINRIRRKDELDNEEYLPEKQVSSALRSGKTSERAVRLRELGKREREMNERESNERGVTPQ